MRTVTLLLFFFCLFTLKANADNFQQTNALDGQKVVRLFNGSMAQYRIPAIVQCKSGKLIAFADHRYGGGDIGSGRIDIVMKESTDGGRTWSSTERMVAEGGIGSAGFGLAHGDAAAVVDRESGDLLVMCASGSVAFWDSNRENPLRVGRYASRDEGKMWTGQEVTGQIYDLLPDIGQAFFSSGRICQSSRIKAGSRYRIYSAIVTHKGNRVVYSDDFGSTWALLGGKDGNKAAPKGDEAKVVELPDGSVLLSSRVSGGRYFNIYKYSDKKKADGSWGEAVFSSDAHNGIAAKDNACNGEVLMVDAKQGKRKVKLLLQSIPLGPQRTNVGIYYKVLRSPDDYASSEAVAYDWEGCYQVSTTTSAYSTMILDSDGCIDFLYEENAKQNHYDIMFKPLTIKQITSGKYK